jgi:hypothetical protein
MLRTHNTSHARPKLRKEQPPSHNTMLVIPVGIRKERAVTESPWPHLLPTSHHRYDLLSSQPE